jgi:hypothetical protein
MAFDFDAAVHVPHRMQPGLRRLPPGAVQLTPTVSPQRSLARHLREKLAVLGAFRDQALLQAPGFDAGPALAALAAHAAAEQPGALQIDGGVSASTIERCAEAGADVFVAGSAVYGADDAAAQIQQLRELAAASC